MVMLKLLGIEIDNPISGGNERIAKPSSSKHWLGLPRYVQNVYTTRQTGSSRSTLLNYSLLFSYM